MILIIKKIKSFLFLRIGIYASLFHIFVLSEVAVAAPFEYQYRSAEFLGRGDTGIASSAGVDAMFYNPAGIAQGTTGQFREFNLVSPQVEGSKDIENLYDKKKEGNSQVLDYVLENKNTPYYVAGQNASAVVFKKFAVGAMQRAEAYAEVMEDTSTGMPYVNAKANIWNGGYVTMAHDMLDGHFLVGVTGKFVQKEQYSLSLNALQIDSQLQNNTLEQDVQNSERKGDALGADFGTMFIFDKSTETQIGAVFRNVGMDYQWVIPANGTAPDSDPQQLDLGASTSFGTKRGRVKLFADYRDVTNAQNMYYTMHTHLGIEYNLENILIFMAGLNQGYLTYGAAVNLRIIRIEAGSYTEEMSNIPGQTPDTRYFARVSLGWMP